MLSSRTCYVERAGILATTDNSTDWCVGRRPELKSVELFVAPRLVIDLLSLLCEIGDCRGDYVQCGAVIRGATRSVNRRRNLLL